ncbi:MAG: DUF6020 family protein [Lachnospiraceae bacterium]|nr:DUF6020 family protein [Lachnospiraceae bacterium]
MRDLKVKEVFGKKVCWYFAAAFLMAVGRAGSLKFYESEKMLLPGIMDAVLFLARLLVYFVLFSGIFAAIEKFINSKRTFGVLFEKGDKPSGKWWGGYVILAAGWLPALLIKYPAALCWDTWAMIKEYKVGYYSEHQSVYYSLVMRRLIALGENVGHPSWGLFVFSVLHYLVLVAAMGYSLQILRKMNVSRAARLAAALLYLLNPYISGYVGVVIKDVPYTAFIVIVFLCLVDMYMDHEGFSRNPLKMGALFISVINIYLIRKNGSYVMLATLLLLLVRCFRKKISKKPAVLMLAAFIVSAACFNGLGTYFHASKGSIREALSLPFQQTARCVKIYGEEVSDEEREAIDMVLPYDRLAGLYNPRISDPVKNEYKKDDSKLPAYFKAWFAGFLRHPLCYISATWEQNYYLFIPEVDNIVLYQDAETGYETTKVVYMPNYEHYYDMFSRNEKLSVLQQWIVKEFQLLHQIPLLGLLGNVSFWFYVFLFAVTVSLAYRADNLLLLALSFFTIVFVILGPAIQGHPRYMFPLIYPMPVLLLFLLYRLKNNSIG